jgi:hypothetical protein
MIAVFLLLDTLSEYLLTLSAEDKFWSMCFADSIGASCSLGLELKFGSGKTGVAGDVSTCLRFITLELSIVTRGCS